MKIGEENKNIDAPNLTRRLVGGTMLGSSPRAFTGLSKLHRGCLPTGNWRLLGVLAEHPSV